MVVPFRSVAALLLLVTAQEAACMPMEKARGKGSSPSVSTALLPVEDSSAVPLHAEASNDHADAAQKAARGEETSFVQKVEAEDVTSDCVTEHNKKRVGQLKKPLMPVRKDAAAAYQALNYAKELVKFGENLFATGGSVATCQGAVTAWYNEIRHFNGKYPGTSWGEKFMDVGHFTQVMWESSTKIGCARTLACEGRSVLVCNYSPPGNWTGQPPFSEEVWESIMASAAHSSSSSWQLSGLLLATGFITVWAAALA